MKILICGGKKGEVLVTAIKKKFSDGSIDFDTEYYLSDLDDYLNRGGSFTRIIVTAQGIDRDDEHKGDLQDNMTNISELVRILEERQPKADVLFILGEGQEDLVDIAYDGCYKLGDRARVLKISGDIKLTVNFMVKACILPFDRMENDVIGNLIYRGSDVSSIENNSPTEIDNNFTEMTRVADLDEPDGFETEDDFENDSDDDFDNDFGDDFNDFGEIEQPEELEGKDTNSEDNSFEDGSLSEDYTTDSESDDLDTLDSSDRDGLDTLDNSGEDAIDFSGFNDLGDDSDTESETDNSEDDSDSQDDLDDIDFSGFNDGLSEDSGITELDSLDNNDSSDSNDLDLSGIDDLFDDNDDTEDNESEKEPELELEDSNSSENNSDSFEDDSLLDIPVDDNEFTGDSFEDNFESEEPEKEPEKEAEKEAESEDDSIEVSEDDNYEDENSIANDLFDIDDTSNEEDSTDEMFEVDTEETNSDSFEDAEEQETENASTEDVNNISSNNSNTSAPNKRRGLFGRVKENRPKQNQQATQSQAGFNKLDELRKMLDTYNRRGHCMVVSGASNSGSTTLAGNIANVVASLGYTVAIVDFDLSKRGQTYLSRDAFLAVNSGDNYSETLVKVINNKNSNISANSAIVKAGLNLFGTNVEEDTPDISKVVKSQDKLRDFIYNLKSIYNFIVFDCPLDYLETHLAELEIGADSLVLNVEPTNKSLLEFTMKLVNISDYRISRDIFNRAKIVVNKSNSSSGKVLGKKYSNYLNMMSLLDQHIYDVTGHETGGMFTRLRVVSSLPVIANLDGYIYNRGYFSDTREGKEMYLKVLSDILI
jgi:dentin sialophosphoprotein (fragment)